jgi:phosphate transport system protein
MRKDVGPVAEFNQVKSALEALAAAVVAQMRALHSASARRDARELALIVERDKEVDKLELDLDKICRTFMELRTPMGPDFRYVLGAMDIARGLERIGDCIEYVARHVNEGLAMQQAFPEGWQTVLSMIERCLDIIVQAQGSWLKSDAKAARAVKDQDDFVDALQEQGYSLVIEHVRSGKVDVELGMLTMLIVNKLEAVADIACHIAETVVFMILAKQIRHEKTPPVLAP